MKDQYAIYRIAGSLLTIYMHVTVMGSISEIPQELMKAEPDLMKLQDLNLRYATVWNLLIQIGYAILSIACDLPELFNGLPSVPNGVKNLRYTVFAGLLFPIGMGIASAFWPVYIYDRRLIFPHAADLVISKAGNAMCHGGIFVYALWELVFLPRDSIKNEMKALKLTIFICAVYLISLFYTRYVDKGVWCYDLFTVTEGTKWFWVALAGTVGTNFIGYYTQWPVKAAVWRYRDSVKKVD